MGGKKTKKILMLEEEKSKRSQKKSRTFLDALTLWFEDIDKEEWSNRIQWYLSEFYEKYIEKTKINNETWSNCPIS